jgi:hypothetical protein
MVNIKIKLLLKAIDGTISFIEFISYDNFIARFGTGAIEDLK